MPHLLPGVADPPLVCPARTGGMTMAEPLPITVTHPHLADEWHPTRNTGLTPDMVSRGSHMRAWWAHTTKSGVVHEWSSTVANRARGSGCPKCAKRGPQRDWSPLTVTHPHLVDEWHPTRNGELTPDIISAGSSRRIWWVHTTKSGVVHEWDTTVKDRTREGTGCPTCAVRGPRPVKPALPVNYPHLADEWHPTRNGDLTPADVTEGSTRRVWWRHVTPDGGVHEWPSRVQHRTAGKGCPECANVARRKPVHVPAVVSDMPAGTPVEGGVAA